jgi:apolipoprotein N-acyltransferase
MARLAKAWPCLASAVLVNLAFAPFHLTFLVFAALVPWLLSLRESNGREGFRSGWTFGFLMMLGQFAWNFSFVNKWVQNPALSLVPYLAMSAAAAVYFGIVGWQTTLCWRHGLPWAIPLVWAGMEVFRSFIPWLAFPYGLIATPLWLYPFMIQSAYYGSIFLLGAWVVLANVILCLLLAGSHKWRHIRGYIAAFLLLLGVSLAKYNEPIPGERIAVTVGQPGTDMAFGDKEQNEALLAKVVPEFQTRALTNGSELLVLPEGIAGSQRSFPPVPPFDIQASPPVVFGGQRGEDPTYQTAFSYDGTWRYADKTRLVIFGEYVPFREEFPLFAQAFQLPGGNLTPGTEVRALKAGKRTVGPLICFEGLFPDLAWKQAMNGAELLAVMSVDDWFMGTNAPEQLMGSSVWRAVETGLPLVRSASRGHSFAVDSQGHIRASLPLGTTDSFRVELPVAPPQPFRFFFVFPLTAFASLLLLPFGVAVAQRRMRGKQNG